MSEADNVVEQAEAALRAGDAQGCRDLATGGLSDDPRDPRLLRLAAQSWLDADIDEAIGHLRTLVTVTPDDPEAWRELGLAEAEAGASQQAVEALRHVVELSPDDVDGLVHLANLSFVLGQPDEAVQLLVRAVERHPDRPAPLANLVDLAWTAGRLDVALDAAAKLAAIDPTNVVALLAIAELNLERGELDLAAAGFDRLRIVDDADGHAAYATHGQVEALLRGEQWRAALDAAIEATRYDRHQLTTDVLSFAAARLFGPGEHPAPAWEDLAAALAAERAEHRRIHIEEVVP